MDKEKAKKELTPFQRGIAIITVVALMVYAAVNVFLVTNAYNQLDDNVSEFIDVLSNWQMGAVTELVVQKNCPAGYESALQDRSWPGVDAGCFCGNVSQTTLSSKNITCAPFCFSSCDATAKSVGCADVPGRGAQVLNSWGVSGVDSMQICLKRSLDTWASVALSSTGSCPSGTITCGTGENLFCTKETKCPVSSITVEVYDPASLATPTAISNCGLNPTTCQVLANTATDKRVVRFTRNDTNVLPLAEFTTNEYSMCNVKSQNNLTPGRSLFSLLDTKPTTCGTEGINKWVVSDTLNETLLFQANGLTSYITSLSAYSSTGMKGYYPTGTTGDNFKWKLFTRGFVPFKASCRNRMSSLVGKRQFITDLRKAQFALLIIGIIASFFLGIPLAFMEFQNLRGVDLPCIDGKGEEERKKLKRIKKLINYVFKGLQIPFQIWAIILAAGAKSLFVDLSDEQCSNAETNQVMVYLANALTKTYTSTLTALGILAATLLLDLIMDIWERRKSKKTQVEIGNASIVSNNNGNETIRVAELDESTNRMQFGKPTPQPAPQIQTQMQPQVQQVQPQVQNVQPQAQPNIVIQLSNPAGPQYPQYPQPQYPPQQYPPQQYPPQQQQYPQYPPQQQYPQYPGY